MKIIDKIFRDKKVTYGIYILLAIGVLLIFAGNFAENEKKTVNAEIVCNEKKESNNNDVEKNLKKILSMIKGAGKVDVMIVYENNGKQEYCSDVSGKTKKTVILSKHDGEQALVYQKKSPDVCGVIIVADGGGNTKVKEELIHAAKTALGIASHRIEVFERNENQ